MVNTMKQVKGTLSLGLILMIITGTAARAQINEEDSLALVVLYNTTDGPNWQDNTDWLAEPVAQWHGVEVTEDRVTGLDLNSNQLTGSIPPELGNLANLRALNLNSNQLTGSIPPELGNLANLEILILGRFLEGNKLTGSIPLELGNLARLKELKLSNNQLTGSIPPELGNLANLVHLLLDGNQLTGSIPPELGNLTNLTWLRLTFNRLTGSIPLELGNLASLKFLQLFNNQLTGSIPPELGNLTTLTELDLGRNQLTGSIPSELGNLTDLKQLILSNNPLSGTLPLSLTNLSVLEGFWFDETDLCEPIDDAFQTWLQGIFIVFSTGCTNVATEEATEVPSDFALEANYPNPFSSLTRIRYALPQRAAVRLSVYDVQGRLVRLLVEAEQAAGWHEVTFEAGALPSGVYFYRLEAGIFRDSKAMRLVK